MIVSIHVPKTARKSFGLRLASAFGPRMLRDYADWIGLDTPEARAEHAAHAAEVHARRHEIARDYDLNYDHFIAGKYAREFCERSVALFEAVFGYKLPPATIRANVNPHNEGEYSIDPAVRRAVDLHRACDVELCRRAAERFARLASRHGV